MTHVLQRRAEVAQAAVDRFAGKPFVWGVNDCASLAVFAMREFGWTPRLGARGSYRTARGAVRHLKRLGFGSLEGAVDDVGLARIAPAAALPGDIVAIPGEAVAGLSMPALTIAVGYQRVLGFLDGRCGVIQPSAWVTAWRVGPCPKP